jgi:hypothetical protein
VCTSRHVVVRLPPQSGVTTHECLLCCNSNRTAFMKSESCLELKRCICRLYGLFGDRHGRYQVERSIARNRLSPLLCARKLSSPVSCSGSSLHINRGLHTYPPRPQSNFETSKLSIGTYMSLSFSQKSIRRPT